MKFEIQEEIKEETNEEEIIETSKPQCKIPPLVDYFPFSKTITKEEVIEIKKLFNNYKIDEANDKIKSLQIEIKKD